MVPDPAAARVALLDGVLVPDGRIAIDVEASLAQCGGGLFETLPVFDGRAIFLDAHLARLEAACRDLRFVPPPSRAAVGADAAKVASTPGLSSCSVRVVVFRDGGRMRRLVVATRLPTDAGAPVALGIAAPHLDGPRTLGRWKTLNCLQSRLAHEDGVARGFDEVVFTQPDGTVLEGTRSSVFLVENDAVVTPPLDLPILRSVTRAVIVDEARRAGLRVLEERFGVDRLRAAGEAFVSASVRGVRPVRSFEGAPCPDCPGRTTERVRALYAAAVLAAARSNPHDADRPAGS